MKLLLRPTAQGNLIDMKTKVIKNFYERERIMKISLLFFRLRVFIPSAGFPQGVNGLGFPIGQRPSPPP